MVFGLLVRCSCRTGALVLDQCSITRSFQFQLELKACPYLHQHRPVATNFQYHNIIGGLFCQDNYPFQLRNLIFRCLIVVLARWCSCWCYSVHPYCNPSCPLINFTSFPLPTSKIDIPGVSRKKRRNLYRNEINPLLHSNDWSAVVQMVSAMFHCFCFRCTCSLWWQCLGQLELGFSSCVGFQPCFPAHYRCNQI